MYYMSSWFPEYTEEGSIIWYFSDQFIYEKLQSFLKKVGLKEVLPTVEKKIEIVKLSFLMKEE